MTEIEENQPSLNLQKQGKKDAKPKTLPLCLLQKYLHQFQRI
jgi:hypothetical protein